MQNATKIAQKGTSISLKGSTKIVTEFFEFAINNILYQRGIYPPEMFTQVNKYSLPMMILNDDGLKKYFSKILTQLEGIFCFFLNSSAVVTYNL